MSEPWADLERAMREVRDRMMREWWEAATREPEPSAPVLTTIPPPDLPWGLKGPEAGVVRYPCMTGCGWAHLERPDMELPGPILLPVNFTSDDVSAAISAQAAQRHAAAGRRIEEAVAAHYAEVHPGEQPHRRRVEFCTPVPQG